MFAQTVVVLLDRAWDQQKLDDALRAFAKREAPSGEQFDADQPEETEDQADEDDQDDESDEGAGDLGAWMGSDTQVRVRLAFDPRVTVVVDAFAAPWPDDMGDPNRDPALFGAWATRWFGWGTFPYGLRRAALQPSARAVEGAALEHRAFLRLHLHYLAGIGEHDPMFPEDRDIPGELTGLAQVALSLLPDASVVGWFVPRAELLLDKAAALLLLHRQARGELVMDAWVSTRLLNGAGRALFETVGLAALERTDQQVLLTDLTIDPERMFELLRQLAFDRAESEPAPTLGPGGLWYPVKAEGEDPPRELVRWSLHAPTEGPLVHELHRAEADALSAHLEKFLGPVDTVWHELVSDQVHLDILLFRARGERRYHVLVTQGMSALPMTTPPDYEAFRHAELMLALPDSWPVMEKGSEAEEHHWPIRQLKMIARLPHAQRTWMAWGHTIPNGAEAEPYSDQTKLCCAMLGLPTATLPREAFHFESTEGKQVHLWGLHFLHRDEMDRKLEHGAQALFERLESKGVSEILDAKRRSAYAKRFWIV